MNSSINLEDTIKGKFFLFVFILLWSCSSTDIPKENNYLVDAELVEEVSANDIRSSLSNSPAATFSLFIKAGVKKYKVTYTTKTPQGMDVVASGALIVPTGLNSAVPLGSYQHGTIFDKNDAPSNFKPGTEADLATLLAGSGIIILVPDYIGYGSTDYLPHPYEHKEGLAQPVVDFLLAAKEFIRQEELNWNGRTFLTGYSEGGYATMASYQKLESQYPNEFDIIAVTCGAGAYDKTGTFHQFLTEGTSGEVINNRSYVWVLLTYLDIYNLNISIKDIFIEPIATEIEQQGINVTIDRSISEVIKDSFKKDFLEGKYPDLSRAIAENDVYDWTPKSILKLFHGTVDTYVPVENSIKAANTMQQNGAQKVELIVLENRNHGTAIGDYFLQTFSFFNINFNP